MDLMPPSGTACFLPGIGRLAFSRELIRDQLASKSDFGQVDIGSGGREALRLRMPRGAVSTTYAVGTRKVVAKWTLKRDGGLEDHWFPSGKCHDHRFIITICAPASVSRAEPEMAT